MEGSQSPAVRGDEDSLSFQFLTKLTRQKGLLGPQRLSEGSTSAFSVGSHVRLSVLHLNLSQIGPQMLNFIPGLSSR